MCFFSYAEASGKVKGMKVELREEKEYDQYAFTYMEI